MPEPMCQALAADGRPCPNPAVAGSDFCPAHDLLAESAGQAGEEESGWLAIDDRRAPGGRLDEPALPTAPPAASQIEIAGQDASQELAVTDRLTEAQRRQALGEAERRGRLQAELTRFGKAAQRLASPEDGTAQPTPDEMHRLMRLLLGPFYPRLRSSLASQYLDPDVWKGMWYVGRYLLRAQTSSLRRRWEGNYEIDDFGLDKEFTDVVMPLAQFFYRYYWRVEVTGLEHVSAQGPALLVSNHSGVLPFDAAMIAAAIYNGTESQRLARALVASWFPTLPFVSILLQKTGQVQASPHNAQQLLERGELVAVFPEGIKGVGKLYRDRYQLLRFGRGGFIKVAVRAGVPIIPVAVVGAEEIYPMLGRVDLIARVLGLPFFPLTPTFPWTGPLGLLPLPSKWSIEFGRPLHVDGYGARAAANPALVARLTEQVRSTIQQMLLDRLALRRSVFLG